MNYPRPCKWMLWLMGIAVYGLAVIIAFYLGFYKSTLFSPPISKPPPMGTTGPAAKPQNTTLESTKPVPPLVSAINADRAPAPAAHPEKPDVDLLPQGASVKLKKTASSQSAPAVDSDAGKEETGLNPADQRIYRQLKSGDPEAIRAGARQLYRHQFENPMLLDLAAEALRDQYRLSSGSWLHVDAMAWICKALGRSGKHHYRPLLDNVARNAPSRKLSGYALRSRRELQ